MVPNASKIGSPYRSPPRPSDHEDHDAEPSLTFGAAVLFVTSAARLLRPILGAEDFGAEPTIAIFALLATGAYFLALFRAWFGRLCDR